jgi:Mg2+ and Co2+ transporter CorA
MSEVTAAIFREGTVIKHVAPDASMPLDGQSEFIWIEVLDPVDSDFAVLQERFGLHTLAVEDSMCPAQLPKVNVYEGQIFVVLKAARLEGDEIKYTEIGAFLRSLPPPVVLIVVDASDDHTPAIIQAVRPHCTHVIRDRSNVTYARQIGAEAATTPWLVFTDADVTFSATYFARLLSLSCSVGPMRLRALRG